MKKTSKRFLVIILALSFAVISCLSSINSNNKDSYTNNGNGNNIHVDNEDIKESPQDQEHENIENPELPNNPSSSENLWQVNHGSNPERMTDSLDLIVGVGAINIFTESYDHNPDKFALLYERGYAYDETAIYTTTTSDNIIAYKISDGTPLWNSEFEGKVIGVGEETVFIHTEDNRIYGLSKHDGRELWKIIIESLLPADQDAVIFSYVFHFDNDYIIPARIDIGYYHNYIGFLHFNEITGDAFFTPNNKDTDSLIQPLMYRDNILLCRDTNNLYELNIMDGSTIWKWGGEDSFTFNSGALYDGLLDFDQENEILYVNVDINSWVQNCTYALNLSTGQPAWDDVICVPEEESEYYCGKGTFSLEKYFFFAYSNSVYVIDKKTGKRINRISSDYSIEVLPTDEGVIIYTPELGIAEAIDPATNEVYWQDDEFDYDSWYYALGNELFFTNENGKLVAMNIKTGEYLWSLDDITYSIYDAYDQQNYLNKTLNIIKDGTQRLILLDLETGNYSTINFEYSWGRNYDLDHIQVIGDHTWIYFGDYLAVIRPFDFDEK